MKFLILLYSVLVSNVVCAQVAVTLGATGTQGPVVYKIDTSFSKTHLYLRNNTDTTIVVSLTRLKITKTILPLGTDTIGSYTGLLLRGGEPYCIKYPTSKNGWVQCSTGADPKTTPFLPVGNYVISFEYNKPKKIWEMTLVQLVGHLVSKL